MVFFVLLTYIALAEGYFFGFLNPEDLQREYKGFSAEAVLTVDFPGPFEATCFRLTGPLVGGLFPSDHQAVLILSAVTDEETKEIERLSVDACDSTAKINETIKSISPLEGDTLPAQLTVVYRSNLRNNNRTGWGAAHPFTKTVMYVRKGRNYVKKESW